MRVIWLGVKVIPQEKVSAGRYNGVGNRKPPIANIVEEMFLIDIATRERSSYYYIVPPNG
jgi:hypothetical protein